MAKYVLRRMTVGWRDAPLRSHKRLKRGGRTHPPPQRPAARQHCGVSSCDRGVSADVAGPMARPHDNGSCFTGRLAKQGAADFEWMLRALGIVQICSRPAHPQTCGKARTLPPEHQGLATASTRRRYHG